MKEGFFLALFIVFYVFVAFFVMGAPYKYIGPVDPDFNPFEGNYLEGYELYYDNFVSARNQQEADYIKNKINYELMQKSDLDGSDYKGFIALYLVHVLHFILWPLAFVFGAICKSRRDWAVLLIFMLFISEVMSFRMRETYELSLLWLFAKALSYSTILAVVWLSLKKYRTHRKPQASN